MGLKLKDGKTRIAHTHLQWKPQKPGFHFLGFHISQPLVGRFKPHGPPVPRIRPTRENQIRHLGELRKILKQHSKTEAVVIKSNSRLQGWAYYYRTVASKRNFRKCDRIMMRQIMYWAYRKHPRRSKKWVINRYLNRIGNRLRFGFYKTLRNTGEQQFLYIKAHADVKIQRHVKVSGDRSPFDGDWIYWTRRGQKNYRYNEKQLRLLRRQSGCCIWCGLVFTPTDIVEIDLFKRVQLASRWNRSIGAPAAAAWTLSR